MTTILFDIHVQYLEDNHEWYAWNNQIDGAHAVGETAQDAVANLSDLLPILMKLSFQSVQSSSIRSETL